MGGKIGVLALQGDVSLHAKALEQLDVSTVFIKKPAQLAEINGLIIPGGESTTLLKLAEPLGFLKAIKDFAASGNHIFGTCAGAILLAKTVTNPVQTSLGLIDITIQRNAYGRQLDSFEAIGQFESNDLPMVFIRAPRITNVGDPVKTLATHKNEAVLVEQNNILAATFHPELTNNLSVYRYWLASF